MEPNTNRTPPDRIKRRKRKWKVILIILGVLICVRIAMPYVILHYANQKLANLEGYYGHIDDIDLNLYRGAYVINDIFINSIEDKDTTEFFKSKAIDLSVEWSAIFNGKIVGEVEFETPVIQYTMGKQVGEGEVKDDSANFIQLVKDFMPLRINRFAVANGEIHYVDLAKNPVIDIPLTNVNIEGTGLTNETDSSVVLPADIKMTAALFNGTLTVNTKLDPLNKTPTFDLNATMTNTDLTNFNNFFNAYANFDVEQGSLGLYCEVAARDGEFTGYVKPLISDLKILHLSQEEGGPLQIVWEGFLGGVVEVLTNQPKDQFATKVEFNGKFSKPDVAIVDAIFAILRNAFIQALQPSLDNDVTLETVGAKNEEKRGLLDRLFNKDGKDKKDKKSNKNK
jgi:hypothetical protein